MKFFYEMKIKSLACFFSINFFLAFPNCFSQPYQTFQTSVWRGATAATADNILDDGNTHRPHCVQQTSDGKFIAVSSTYESFVISCSYLIKLNTNGSLAWSKTIGENPSSGIINYGHSVAEISGGGYIISGDFSAYGGTALVKTDVSGNVLWANIYSDLGRIFSVREVIGASPGFIVIGNRASGGIFIMKTDLSGVPAWGVYYLGGNSGNTFGWDITQIDDDGDGVANNGFVACGQTNNSLDVNSSWDGYAMRLNADGTPVWERGYVRVNFSTERLSCIIQLSGANGDFMVTGGTTPNLLRLAFANGAIVSQSTYSNVTSLRAIKQCSNGDLILTGRGGTTIGAILIRTDVNGAVIWANSYGQNHGLSVWQNSDGGFILFANNGSYGGSPSLGKDVILIRTAPNGGQGAGCTVNSFTPVPSALAWSSVAISTQVSLTPTNAAFVPGNSLPNTWTNVCSALLPVELLSFSALCKNEKVICEWSTASEINNDYFSVEKNSDGKNWTEIGKVNGSGNSTTKMNYEFIDETTIAGSLIYYRLKQVDFDGRYEYFGPSAAIVSPSDDWNLILQNTASENELSGTLFLSKEDKIQLQICDVQGKIVMSNEFSFNKGNNLIKLNLENIEKGVYFIKLNNSKALLQKKFVRI